MSGLLMDGGRMDLGGTRSRAPLPPSRPSLGRTAAGGERCCLCVAASTWVTGSFPEPETQKDARFHPR